MKMDKSGSDATKEGDPTGAAAIDNQQDGQRPKAPIRSNANLLSIFLGMGTNNNIADTDTNIDSNSALNNLNLLRSRHTSTSSSYSSSSSTNGNRLQQNNSSRTASNESSTPSEIDNNNYQANLKKRVSGSLDPDMPSTSAAAAMATTVRTTTTDEAASNCNLSDMNTNDLDETAGAVGGVDVQRTDPNSLLGSLRSLNTTPATSTNNTTSNTSQPTSSTSANLIPPPDCPICLQTCVHPARLPCGHIFCFLCIKGVAYKNRRCAMCRREIPTEYLNRPHLLNGINDVAVTKATEDGYQWFYEGRNGGWWAYDSRTAEYIEEHFQIYQQQQQKHAQAQIEEVENKDDNKARYQQQLQQQEEQQPPPPPQPNQTYLNNTDSFNVNHTCDVLVCGSIYIIDFLKMIQYPENNKRKVRKIHRSKDIHAKGWWQYDDRTSQDLEEAFKKGEKSCTILVAGYVYTVDFEAMMQQRQNEPTRCRRVKRDLATIQRKGVAGLRIEGNIVITDIHFPTQQRPIRPHLFPRASFNLASHNDGLNNFNDLLALPDLNFNPPPQYVRGPNLGLRRNYNNNVNPTDMNYRAPLNGSRQAINRSSGFNVPNNPHDNGIHSELAPIAATDEAIRIATDIFDSTLANVEHDYSEQSLLASVQVLEDLLDEDILGINARDNTPSQLSLATPAISGRTVSETSSSSPNERNVLPNERLNLRNAYQRRNSSTSSSGENNLCNLPLNRNRGSTPSIMQMTSPHLINSVPLATTAVDNVLNNDWLLMDGTNSILPQNQNTANEISESVREIHDMLALSADILNAPVLGTNLPNVPTTNGNNNRTSERSDLFDETLNSFRTLSMRQTFPLGTETDDDGDNVLQQHIANMPSHTLHSINDRDTNYSNGIGRGHLRRIGGNNQSNNIRMSSSRATVDEPDLTFTHERSILAGSHRLPISALHYNNHDHQALTLSSVRPHQHGQQTFEHHHHHHHHHHHADNFNPIQHNLNYDGINNLRTSRREETDDDVIDRLNGQPRSRHYRF